MINDGLSGMLVSFLSFGWVPVTVATFKRIISNDFYIKLKVSQTELSIIMITKNSNITSCDDFLTDLKQT